MQYLYYQPHPYLQPYIACLWSSKRDFRSFNGAIDILPDSYIDLIFNFGSDCHYEYDQSYENLPPNYVARLIDRPFRLYSRGVLNSVGVRFYAWGFNKILRMELNTSNIIYPLEDDWVSTINLMRLAVEANNQERALNILEDNLLNRLVNNQNSSLDLMNPPKLLFERQGNMTVRQLAESSYLSRRQIERRFQDMVGISPKTMARMIRFQYIRDEISLNPNLDLTRLAYKYGFSDSSHLSREFKEFSNRTPTRFISEIQTINEALRYGVAYPSLTMEVANS